MRKLLWSLGVGAIVAPLMVIGAYAAKFAPESWLIVSRDPDDWAKFGEYVGGSLGAFYGFLAFIGVLVTIRIQQNQSKLDELQRLMAMVSEKIDTLFAMEPSTVDPDVRKRMDAGGNKLSVFMVLSGIGTAALGVGTTNDRNELIRRGREQIKHDASLLAIEFQHLVAVLNAYVEAGGSDTVRVVYEDRYRVSIAWLAAAGLLSSASVERYFNANGYAADLRRRWSAHGDSDQPV